MSLFKKIGKVLKKAAPVLGVAASVIPGVGPVAGAAIRAAGAVGKVARVASAVRTVASVVKGPPRIPTTTAAMAAPIMAGAPMLRSLPTLARAGAGAIARVARTPAGRAVGRVARDVGTVVAGGLVIDAITGEVIGRRRRRRINPLNGKAAKRAIRRIKAVRKITMEIERMLPRARASKSCPPPFARRKKRC